MALRPMAAQSTVFTTGTQRLRAELLGGIQRLEHEIDKPVGGFGTREELFAGYEEAGRKVDADRVMFWEVMGTLRWGIMCCGMMQRFRAGPDHSMERAMIGRRSSETEIDLLRLLAPRGG